LTAHADQHGGWKQDLIEKATIALNNIGLENVGSELLAKNYYCYPKKLESPMRRWCEQEY